METRLYSMSDADLKQLADDIKDSIRRDAAEFATRNISDTHLAKFETLINAFDATTTDVEMMGMVTVAVEEKDALVHTIQKAIRPIRNMAEQAFDGKGFYKIFGFKDMIQLSDNDLYRLARRVVRVGTLVQADLAEQGLAPDQLTNLNALATQLDKAIDKVGDAGERREFETHNRVKKGNLMYKEMSRLASIGQSLFFDTDLARYNDYVLVDSDPGADGPTPPQAGA